MGKIKDITNLIGQKYYRLELLSDSEIKINNKRTIICKCDCNTIHYMPLNSWGYTKSCGCLQKEKAKITAKNINLSHGAFGTKLYGVWNTMKQRCNNPNVKYYSDYGGRGIIVCNEWKEFIPFRDWALNNDYKEGLSIERIDNNGNYEPNNCYWATRKQQGSNKRNNVKIIDLDGNELSIEQLSKKTGIKIGTLYERRRLHPNISYLDLIKNVMA